MRLILSAVMLLATTSPAAHAAALLNGVGSGDVGQSSATLWARATAAGALSFEVSSTADFSNIVFRNSVASDGDVPTHQAVGGLSAGTRYYYRATDALGNRSAGRFVTAHPTGARAGLRFGVSGDARGDLAPFPAIANADDRNLDFFVHLGDSIYADSPSPALPIPQARTLSDFRLKHAEQVTPRDGLNTWVDLRQSTSFFATIDDHEVTNDFAGGARIATDARFAGTGAPDDLINTSTLYRNGLQGFQEYLPIEARVWSGTGDSTVDGRPDLYRSQRFGLDAQMIVLDARSFRDQAIGGSPAQVLARSFTPGRTLLGDPQFQRLKDDLVAAQLAGVTWKFISIPEPIQNFGPLGAPDRYEGYAAERFELLAFIEARSIHNVVFIAADIHGTAINNLTYQELNEANPELSFLGPQLRSSAFEVTTGAVIHPTPLGPGIVGLALQAGLITPQQFAFYQSLPVAPDTDSLLNDKDDFVKMLLNGQLGTTPTPGNAYSLIGLEDSGLEYDLVSGDWVIGHAAGWTEFAIDPLSQQLSILTWGITFTDVIAALGDPGALAALSPRLLGELRVGAVVPEPASWAMLVAGFGLLGSALRRRRRCVAA